MKDEIWVLGATGLVVRAVGPRLHEAAVSLVLVGRTASIAESGPRIGEGSAPLVRSTRPSPRTLPAGSVA
jgi:hypothetical protein